MSSDDEGVSGLKFSRVPKFNAARTDNYQHWRVRIMNRLESRDLWELVSGEKKPPTTATTSGTGGSEAQDDPATKKYRKNLRKAAGIISDGLGSVPFNMVCKYTNDPKKMWDILESRYAQRGVTRMSELLRAVTRKSLGRNESMIDHISKMRSLFDQIDQCHLAKDSQNEESTSATSTSNAVGVREYLAEEMQCVLLMQSVESNTAYALTFASIESAEHSELNWDKISTRLIEAYEKLQGQKQREGGRANLAQQTTTCFHCSKRGHKAVDCWKNPKSKNYKGGAMNTVSRAADSSRSGTDKINNYKGKPKGKSPVAAVAMGRSMKAVSRDKQKNIKGANALPTTTDHNDDRNTYIIDSGASEHMSWNRDHFVRLSAIPSRPILLGDGRSILCEAKGEVELELIDQEDHETTLVKLNNVLYCPDLGMNLISAAALDKNNIFISTEKGVCYMYKKAKSGQQILVGMAELGEDGLYRVYGKVCNLLKKNNRDYYATHVQSKENTACKKKTAETNNDAESAEEVPTYDKDQVEITSKQLAEVKTGHKSRDDINGEELWHRRLGHVSHEMIKRLSKNAESGVNLKDKPDTVKCGPCMESKMARGTQRSSLVPSSTQTGDVVFSDLCGPMNFKGRENSRYVVTFIEGKSRWVKIFLSTNKRAETILNLFKVYKSYFERQNGVSLKRLHTDNGTEYINEEFQYYMEQQGVEHTTTAPYTPQSNGVAERYNLTLLNSVRSMLRDAGLGQNYWPDAALQACRTLNRIPQKGLNNKSPYEVLTGRVPHLNGVKFKTFGCLTFVKVPSEKRKKLDEKSVPTIYLGTERGNHVKVLDPDNGNIYVVRHAKFDETIYPGFKKTESNKRLGWFDTADERDKPKMTVLSEGDGSENENKTYDEFEKENHDYEKELFSENSAYADSTESANSEGDGTAYEPDNDEDLPLEPNDEQDLADSANDNESQDASESRRSGRVRRPPER